MYNIQEALETTELMVRKLLSWNVQSSNMKMTMATQTIDMLVLFHTSVKLRRTYCKLLFYFVRVTLKAGWTYIRLKSLLEIEVCSTISSSKQRATYSFHLKKTKFK